MGHLLCKHEVLSLNPKLSWKNLCGTVDKPITPTLWGTKTGESLGFAGCQASSGFSGRPRVKERKQRVLEQGKKPPRLASAHMHGYIHPHIRTCTLHTYDIHACKGIQKYEECSKC